MVTQHYRWDFIGLSTDEKPTPETSEKVVDGSTYYESDTSKLFIFFKDTWYEKESTGGGGDTPSINVVQTTGTSESDVMSQNATTTMVFADPNQKRQVRIGNTNTTGSQAVSIGFGGLASGVGAIQIGSATASGNRAIAIGADANSSYDGSVSIGQEAQVYRYGTGVAVGKYAMANADATTAIGAGFSNQSGTGTRVNAQATGSTAIGYVAGTTNSAQGSVALGAYSLANRVGEVNVGSTIPQYGFNLTNYRVIGGVHDGQLANDAVNVSQINSLIDAINTATGSSIAHIGS